MVKGQPASKGTARGTLRFIKSPNEVSDFESGDILLADLSLIHISEPTRPY